MQRNITLGLDGRCHRLVGIGIGGLKNLRIQYGGDLAGLALMSAVLTYGFL